MEAVGLLLGRARTTVEKARRSWVVPCLALTVLGVATATTAQKPTAERPTYVVGDQWLLKDGVYDLIRVEKDRYVFAAGANRQIHLTKDLALVSVIKDRVIEWDLFPIPEIPWPLEVGKWGVNQRATFRSRDHPAGAPVRYTWEVKAYEDVRVGGSSIKAFQILYTVTVETGDPFRRGTQAPGAQFWQLATWYAPDVRRIVKVQASNIAALNLEVVTVDRPPAVSLEVMVDAPKENAGLSADRISVEGKVTGATPLARVVATLNGTEVFSQDLRTAATREKPLSFEVAPADGKNLLVVTAEDAQGGRRQEARVFFRDRPAASAAAAAPSTPSAPAGAPRPAAPDTPTPPAGGPRPAAPESPAGAPLQVTISSPTDQLRVTRESTALAAVASGGKGVSRVLVTLNGVEVTRVEERTAQRAIPVNAALKLQDGQNVVVVTATDADGVTRQEARSIVFERVTPLTIEVRHPEDRARLTDESSVAAAVASSSQGVAEVTVLLNGTQVFQ